MPIYKNWQITNQELNKLNIKTANEIKQSESSENNVKQSQCENEGMSMQRRFLLLILHNFKFIPYILSKIFFIYRKKYIVMVTEWYASSYYKEKKDDLKNGRLRQGQFWEIITKEINRINPNIKKLQFSAAIKCLV